MASSSSHQHDVEHRAFSGIEPDTKRRKVSESSRLFDVFINHRGPDAKETLAVPLYSSLQELRLQAFLDREEMELGDYFPSTIETAIRSASVHIAIFSERYAESAWCLTELILMLESGAKIFPIFYGVRPCELRYIENGAYADAFTSYKKKCRYLQKLESWKKALQSASLITGLEIDSAESFRNSQGFKNFVLDVQKEVERTKPLFVAKHPVALHKLVKDFESQCLEKLVHDFESRCGLNRKGKDQSKIVGIFGMGGAGKTTLAKELFNRKRSNYMATCFLFDVREKSSRFGLPSLQAEVPCLESTLWLLVINRLVDSCLGTLRSLGGSMFGTSCHGPSATSLCG
ncbi:disease resistance protein Roq1-like [Cryptomeria japonica]|uniref:disease resistance protein Roq1-like n=1 Tax=Cryptomeria japonica TaxID=3369 RepID=UPI0027D9EDAB|nr:disease resistance protein Roq1-like [Cryptomeria japonica]